MSAFVKEVEFPVASSDPEVQAIAWSPDGGILVTLAPVLRYAKAFSIAPLREIGTARNFAGGGRSIAIAADRAILIPAFESPTSALSRWNPVTGTIINVVGPDPSSGGAVTNNLLDFDLDRSRSILIGVHRVRLGAGNTFHVAVYDARTWRLVADHDLVTTVVALRPDGQRIAVAGQGGEVAIADTMSGRVVLSFQSGESPVRHLAWSADGRNIAIGTPSQGDVVNAPTGQPSSPQRGGTLQIWDANNGQRSSLVREQIGGVESLDFSSDGRWLIATSADGALRLWPADGGQASEIITDDLHGTAVACFSPDSGRIALARTRGGAVTVFKRVR